MTVRVTLDTDVGGYFENIDTTKVVVTTGGGERIPFINFTRLPISYASVGEAGGNSSIFSVGRNGLTFSSNVEFQALGKVSGDAYQAGRLLVYIADLVKRRVLIVEKDGTPLSSDDVLDFTP